jgi:beta-ribofuranosylaminobenzene 5'-phosphate synthase
VWTRVSTSARLHFGLFNLSGLNHRVDGGAGLALRSPACTVTVREDLSGLRFYRPVSEGMAAAVASVLDAFTSRFNLGRIGLVIDQNIPEHAGLGSKTASLMALGRALSQHFSLGLDYMDIARLIKRGGTSGVGIHASEFGGIVVDAGHVYPAEKSSFLPSSASVAPPAQLAEHRLAPDKCYAIHMRLDSQGLSGACEKSFFQRNCPIPDEETLKLLDVVYAILLPSIKERSLLGINEALAAVQGLGLKAREWAIQRPDTKAVRESWEDARRRRRDVGLPPMCLSSLGPTIFILSDDPESVVAHLIQLGIERRQISIDRPGAGSNLIATSSADAV